MQTALTRGVIKFMRPFTMFVPYQVPISSYATGDSSGPFSQILLLFNTEFSENVLQITRDSGYECCNNNSITFYTDTHTHQGNHSLGMLVVGQYGNKVNMQSLVQVFVHT